MSRYFQQKNKDLVNLEIITSPSFKLSSHDTHRSMKHTGYNSVKNKKGRKH